MKITTKSVVILLGLVLIWFASCFAVDAAQDNGGATTALSAESGAEKLLSGLSDQQVRQMLLDELKADALDNQQVDSRIKGPAHLLSSMLETLTDKHDQNEDQFRELWAGIPLVIPDLYKVFIKLCPYGTSQGAILNILWVIGFIATGLLIEFLLRKTFVTRYFSGAPDNEITRMGTIDKLLAGITQVLPDILGLIFFFGAAYFSFMLFIWTNSPFVQLFFLAVLTVISVIRLVSIISHIFFAPGHPPLRLLPVDDSTARLSHRLIVWTISYIAAALMLAVVARKLGALPETVMLLQLFFATTLLLITAGAIIVYRKQVSSLILKADAKDGREVTWGRKQFASVWHILALTYLTILWFLLVNDLTETNVKNSGAFILSFFVVPIWMVTDRLVQWLVKYSMSTLKIHQESYDDRQQPTEEDLIHREKGRDLYFKIKRFASAGVIIALILWIASLWSIRIPLFSNLASVLFDVIIILTLALVFWQFISSWIERKIQESIPEEDDDEQEDDEWGGAAKRGRAYTLLPMLRKFIGSILAVMVTMTILSSIGVDIGPLLAGAGVVGLAIGFGAQKLVADIFSGFFYLLDDAFRVGEYLTAGSVSGTVESITLRNVMLRHHRGMLQIVPHSELGPITNFMRGGIIVKFNLDFPYDAPIEKIRKIIKKVGKNMLENEEYGKDFIKPLKSQGVREIANSVMTIRVKFTAQPGTHFVIRREAYRLITEALNEQGIYFAHRKVIVDLPEQPENGLPDNENSRGQAVKLAGAAVMRELEEEEAQKAAEENNNNGAMD